MIKVGYDEQFREPTMNKIQLGQTSIFSETCEYFNDNWQTYQKILQNNYMEHREIYSVLRKFIVHRFQKPFQLLDLGCGDASLAVPALIETSIRAYYGIDLSQAALTLAADNLSAIACAKTLVAGDFTVLVPPLINNRQERFDIILASFSLHHLHLKQKDELIGDLHQLLNLEGVLLVVDIVRQEAEDRTTYIDRYLKHVRHDWTALTPQEVASVESHITSSDFPETQEMLQQLALERGFSKSECLYQDELRSSQILCFYK